jgi:hypothetical protein
MAQSESLSDRLSMFQFDLDTLHMLHKMGRTNQQLVNEMSNFGFNSELVNLVLNNQPLFNRVMLRLNLYAQQNTNENNVRSGFQMLNSNLVSNLLNHLYNSTTPQQTTPQQTTQELSEEEPTDENPFDLFFNKCVNQTGEATDVLKASDAFDAFSEWWREQKYQAEMPDKKELKEYLTGRLGKSQKSTWTNVCLSN